MIVLIAAVFCAAAWQDYLRDGFRPFKSRRAEFLSERRPK